MLPFLEAVPVLILTELFLGILLTSFGVLLQALYLSGDMDFLLAAPVPIRAVFIAKLLQAVLPNFGLIALFGLPVLFGLGMSEGYNLLYYPLVLLVHGRPGAGSGRAGVFAGHVGRASPATPPRGRDPGFPGRHPRSGLRPARQFIQRLQRRG